MQIKIETGHCILRANQTHPPSAGTHAGAQRQLTKRLSAKDLKNKVYPAGGAGQSVTQLQVPSLDAKLFYTSDESRSETPASMKVRFGVPGKVYMCICTYYIRI